MVVCSSIPWTRRQLLTSISISLFVCNGGNILYLRSGVIDELSRNTGRWILLKWPTFDFGRCQGPNFFIWPFFVAIFVFFYQSRCFPPWTNKGNPPCMGQIIFFWCFRAKIGQKRHVAEQHGELRVSVTPQMLFIFICLLFVWVNKYIWGVFRSKFAGRKLKKKI